MRAYVLIDCYTQDARRIAGELHRQNGVILADVVNGPQPVVAVVEGEEPAGLAGTILFRIRKTAGVNDITVYLTEPEGSENVKEGHRQTKV